ncbi:MAG: hypothetical protein FE78DRAFT_93319 [Acidomyces sp. 'richmondensis']|nr:MAG: hypothetical protein FE78DRAFT_93319 [Acidomyces sp. 'richmondensis']
MTFADKKASLWEIYKRVATSYNAIVEAIDPSDETFEKVANYMHLALEHFKEAFL